MSLADPPPTSASRCSRAWRCGSDWPPASFVPLYPSFAHIVGPAAQGGDGRWNRDRAQRSVLAEHPAGVFNLIPIPPLDGYGILGLFLTEGGALRLQEWRAQIRSFALIGLIVAWQVFDRFFPPIFAAATDALYAGITVP